VALWSSCSGRFRSCPIIVPIIVDSLAQLVRARATGIERTRPTKSLFMPAMPTTLFAAKRQFPPIGLLTDVDGQGPVITGRSP